MSEHTNPLDPDYAALHDVENVTIDEYMRKSDRVQALTLASTLNNTSVDDLFTHADAILTYMETGHHGSASTESLGG